MKKSNQRLTGAVAALAVFVLAGSAFAQNESSTNRNRGRDLRNLDWQNMDPQEIQKVIQQRMMETYRERLEVTDDAEWKLIEERVSTVTQARMATLTDGGGLMGFGGMGGRPGGFGPGGGGPPGGGRGLQSLFGQPSAEVQALQQAIEAKAPAAEIKAKLAKLQEIRKQKHAELVKAQNELRQLLTPRQEAIAVLMGLLE
jgi:hypothetical protein